MSREIKFRLIQDGKIVGYEWHKPTKKGRIQLHHSKDGKKWKLLFNGVDSFCGWINHDKKEQYTGTKDKNKVEIYEGDIIGVKAECGERSENWIVMWWPKCSQFVFGNGSLDVKLAAKEDYVLQARDEVVGTIHQNPELLND